MERRLLPTRPKWAYEDVECDGGKPTVCWGSTAERLAHREDQSVIPVTLDSIDLDSIDSVTKPAFRCPRFELLLRSP